MLVFPNAKINLGLNILRKRPDGFHDIETIFYLCFGYQDIVELVLSKETEIKIFGDVTVDGDPMDNLCMKAYCLLREDFDIPPVKINLFTNAHTSERGCQHGKRAVYRKACMDGWAPAPTNEYQKAIWDQVHAIPTKPIKIEFDPKTDTK